MPTKGGPGSLKKKKTNAAGLLKKTNADASCFVPRLAERRDVLNAAAAQDFFGLSSLHVCNGGLERSWLREPVWEGNFRPSKSVLSFAR